ncbi:hypothetical protein Bca52824_020089 [Brassica carinata]|uniref:Uncharacterized protein n=1 Tax=Brassica carinata TaxID=52824 RepID=A0A8X7VTN8_BRACI|nr:hypothetical protein Bca52824_020089 [Brassica carinata]
MDSMQSFDALTHNLRECFLDMGSFLKDQKIIVSTIIDVWSGLYGKENNICMNYLQELASHNLLKLLPLGNFQTWHESLLTSLEDPGQDSSSPKPSFYLLSLCNLINCICETYTIC